MHLPCSLNTVTGLRELTAVGLEARKTTRRDAMELEAAHPGASGELAGSRYAGVVVVALDAAEDRDSTLSMAACRRLLGTENKVS
jgi:hypothetical protein